MFTRRLGRDLLSAAEEGNAAVVKVCLEQKAHLLDFKQEKRSVRLLGLERLASWMCLAFLIQIPAVGKIACFMHTGEVIEGLG